MEKSDINFVSINKYGTDILLIAIIEIEHFAIKILNKYKTLSLISAESNNSHLPKCIKIEKEYSELRKKYTKYEFNNVCK